jgi:hypothetical protein
MLRQSTTYEVNQTDIDNILFTCVVYDDLSMQTMCLSMMLSCVCNFVEQESLSAAWEPAIADCRLI